MQAVLHLSYDPDKINSTVNPDLSPEDLEAQLKFWKNETAIMMTLYRALEGLVKKAETAELGSPLEDLTEKTWQLISEKRRRRSSAEFMV